VALEGWQHFKGVAEKWFWRLFTKNTGLCESATRRIGTDTCPVLEGQEEGLVIRKESEAPN
jgi:hypothetical protein